MIKDNNVPSREQKIVRRHYKLSYYPSTQEVVAEKENILRRWKAGTMLDDTHRLAAALSMELTVDTIKSS